MEIPPGQRQFECEHCQAAILVPVDLPPTSAPCPVCRQITTSPGPDTNPSSVPQVAQGARRPIQQPSTVVTDAYQESDNKGAGILWGLAILTLVGLLAGGYYLYQEYRVRSEAGIVDPKDGPSIRTASRPTFDGVEKEALEILEKFLDAETTEEKSQYVIGKSETLPEMKAYYGGGGDKDQIRADYFSEWAMDTTDTDRGIYLLEYDRPKQFKMSELFSPVTDFETHLTLKEPDLQTKSLALRENFEMEAERARIFFKQDQDGELLLDWHTYVQTKDRTFRDFINFPVAGRKKVFRLFIAEDVGTILRGDPALREYRLVDPAHSEEDIAKVFVEKKTQVGQILEELAWTDVIGKTPNGKSITLELEWGNEDKPELKISRIICWEFLGVGGDLSNLSRSN